MMGRWINTYLLHWGSFAASEFAQWKAPQWVLIGVKFSIHSFFLATNFLAPGHNFAAVMAFPSWPWGCSQELGAVWLDRYRASLLLLKDQFCALCQLQSWCQSHRTGSLAVFYCSSYVVLLVLSWSATGLFCQPIQNFIVSGYRDWLPYQGGENKHQEIPMLQILYYQNV